MARCRRTETRSAVRAAAGIAAALILASVPGGLTGQDEEADPAPLVGDRPDFTESAVAVRPGRVQVEAGYTFSRSGGTRLHDLGEALMRVGLVPHAELRIGVNSFSVRDTDGAPSESGVRDVRLGTKLALPEPEAGAVPKAALLVGTTLPTGSDGFGARGVRPGAAVALDWDLGERAGFGANAGYAREKEGGDRLDEFSASGAVSLDLTSGTGVFAEYFGLYRDAAADENFLSGGLTHALGPDLQVDGRAGVRLEGPGPGYFVGAGVIVRR